MSHLHADTLVAKVKERVPVEIVVNAEIAEELRKEPFLIKIRDIAGCDHFRMYVAPVPLHMGLTVTDSTLSFGLCHPDDLKYDIQNDLIATDIQAIEWG
ncbi:transcriptional regulator FilR1 domain-containing protein [Methanogenium organophilum]|uniref:DUF1724 domain-containing protein n=1 Tax=Methanogenium organophilum TaxID=2199 RepID=A0A9X9S1N9_METOG|nr:transcriptional regulator FilR1 domain-containing protein [Methanogenium organophilum]WAI00224.1 DUF1724 domain-containing protein [Methanogenium organophilum]